MRVSFVATNHKPLGTRQHYEGKDGHQPEVPRVPWGLFPEGSESFWRRLEKVGEGSRKLENFEKVGEHLGESTNKYANEVRKMEQIDGS